MEGTVQKKSKFKNNFESIEFSSSVLLLNDDDITIKEEPLDQITCNSAKMIHLAKMRKLYNAQNA